MRAGITRTRGLALVIVLFILVIMTISVAWLSEEILISLRRTENNRDSQQAWQMLVGSEAWALSVLARDSLESETDHLGEAWNNLGQGVAIEHGSISTAVEDLQGRLNLNNLLVEAEEGTQQAGNQPRPRIWTEAFRRLLLSLKLDPNLSDAVLDWLDPDQNVRGTAGAEDADYLGLTPPYRAANRAFSDVSELLWVKGFDNKTVKMLTPYVTALPATDVRININTASSGLLRILAGDLLSEDSSEQLQSSSTGENGLSVEEFLQNDMMAGEQEVAAPLIDNKSSYFMIRSTTKFGRASMKINSLVERKDGLVTVIKRSPVF
ncbi:MAG: type II secretion system minor pseudopilin GspK [Arenicellales bacterium]